MRMLCFFLVLIFAGCNDSKWEIINGSGIDDGPKSLDPIYFENLDKGVVGGYALVHNSTQENREGLNAMPVLYLTEDGGKIWNQVTLDAKLLGRITNVYRHNDTLICTIEDSTILFSNDKGKTVEHIKKTVECRRITEEYFSFNRYKFNNHDFEFEGVEYRIKERYENSSATVIVCRGPETLTDYYFVSFDGGHNWKYLQSDYGDVRQRFLYEDKYLVVYDHPFGVKRLRLK